MSDPNKIIIPGSSINVAPPPQVVAMTQQGIVMCAMLCFPCLPGKQSPAFFVKNGNSMCGDCAKAERLKAEAEEKESSGEG